MCTKAKLFSILDRFGVLIHGRPPLCQGPQSSSDRHGSAGLVLAGAGHAHAALIALWGRRRRCRPPGPITLVSRGPALLYSGLLPAVVAGLVAPREARIGLRCLCRRAGVRLVLAEIVGLDPAGRHLLLAAGPPLAYARLSLDVGSITASVGPGEQPVRPLEQLLPLLSDPRSGLPRVPARLRLRGGGAAAVELALALRARGWQPSLLLRGAGLRLGSAAADRRGAHLLAAAGIGVERFAAADLPAHLACTGSRAPAWLAASGLPVDVASGRVLTESSLQVRGHPDLFASGDCGLVVEAPRPPAGVWAVRAVPVLATNLRRSQARRSPRLRRWRPPARARPLRGAGGAGPGRARALALHGRWCLGPSRALWLLKLLLDRQFVRRLRPRQARRTRPCPSSSRAA
ncbi:MAG: hypothetical protein ACK55B_11885 [Cyanobacteriota bacterium]